ncbi:MAG: hypothetical protein ACLSVD_09055 [Eggerthellaceae bacterium]
MRPLLARVEAGRGVRQRAAPCRPRTAGSDARRRSTLITLGFTVVTVSKGQVMDSGAFNRLAHQLAKRLGKRLRYVDPGYTRAPRAARRVVRGDRDTRGDERGADTLFALP